MPGVTISPNSAALLHELREGMRVTHGDQRTEEQLVDDAIERVHRGFFGLPAGAKGGPDPNISTGPFRKWASDRQAEVLLRQVDPKRFKLTQPFRYDDGARRFDIVEGDATDLASVPSFLTWLIPRYGRHTLAALAHDRLQKLTNEFSPEEADEIFRDSMGQTGTPLIRRWLMWSGVAMRTHWTRGVLAKVLVVLWMSIFTVAALRLWWEVVFQLVSSHDRGSLVFLGFATTGAALAPAALSWVWGRHWRIGAIAGVGVMFFSPQILLVSIALLNFRAFEWSVERFVNGKRRNPVFARNLSRR